jgi:hypothetical protein
MPQSDIGVDYNKGAVHLLRGFQLFGETLRRAVHSRIWRKKPELQWLG